MSLFLLNLLMARGRVDANDQKMENGQICLVGALLSKIAVRTIDRRRERPPAACTFLHTFRSVLARLRRKKRK